ncbi:hypothetical protein JCM30237_25090 [Halolamina litorea]|uniref:Uncharacterized protein n=1 Tax=Halolamina litorea TaxID=1515593 RepID=A0ABD6BU96_9EURY|nr:hypothetical protein [Halolamina litorea]
MTGFDDLNEAGKEQVAAADTDEEATDSVAANGSAIEGTDDAGSNAGDEQEPAFPFDEAVQAQIYPRKTTHDEFEDFLDIDVKRLLRDRGVRNEAGRELHEAVLRVAMEHPEEIADELAAGREE